MAASFNSSTSSHCTTGDAAAVALPLVECGRGGPEVIRRRT